MTTTPYDEFGYFSDNASEHGIAYEAPPVVRREMVNPVSYTHLTLPTIYSV